MSQACGPRRVRHVRTLPGRTDQQNRTEQTHELVLMGKQSHRRRPPWGVLSFHAERNGWVGKPFCLGALKSACVMSPYSTGVHLNHHRSLSLSLLPSQSSLPSPFSLLRAFRGGPRFCTRYRYSSSMWRQVQYRRVRPALLRHACK